MKKRLILTALTLAAVLSLTACSSSKKEEDVTEKAKTAEETKTDRETLFQVSLLQGLTFGDYYGSITAAELKQNGDTGLGTFDGLDGEMIVLDGVVYKAKSDGSVEAVSDDETIPFSNVTFFDEDETEDIESVADIDELKGLLNEKIEQKMPNGFCVIRIDGTFKEMNVRSEYEQKEPYKPLAKVLETDQTFFDYTDVEGTVVGLYCPPYMDKLNATGWHLHFISKDKEKGGHILGLNIDKAKLALDYTEGFAMKLPDNAVFNGFDLTVDQSEDIKEVETGE